MISNAAAGTERFRSAGIELARQLAGEAVWADGMCAFHGATAPESLAHPPRARSMGADLYEGSAGIARFLGLAAACSGDERVRLTALGAVRHALAYGEGWSLFSGRLGAGLVALELAERLGEPDLVAGGVALVDRAGRDAALAVGAEPHAAADPLPGAAHASRMHFEPDSSAADREPATDARDRGPRGRTAEPGGVPSYDLLSGGAGVVLGLVAALGHDTGDWRALAVRLGRALLAAAVPDGPESPDGPPLSWPLERGSGVRLCGLAHGASGMALALEALAGADPDGAEGWRTAARRARAFERAHYSREAGSWADLRPQEPDGTRAIAYPHMWCHGSVGVSAERLGALRHDELARADAVGGLAGARAHAEQLTAGPAGPGAGDAVNGSLCHGLAGLLDLFLDAWLVSGDSSWKALAEQLGDLMLNDARRSDGWRSGVQGGWPAPGLMLGQAGTGWALLRLSEPDAIPSGWRFRSDDGGL